MISFSSQGKVAGIGAAFLAHYTYGSKAGYLGMMSGKVCQKALLFSQLQHQPHTGRPRLSAFSLRSHFHSLRSTTGPQQVEKQGTEFTYCTHELYVHSVSGFARICLQPRHNV